MKYDLKQIDKKLYFYEKLNEKWNCYAKAKKNDTWIIQFYQKEIRVDNLVFIVESIGELYET